jgi:hypothetical protein
MNRLPAVAVLLTLALTYLPAQAQPAAPTNAPLPDRELVIATREVPPFVMKRKDGSWHGISIALWQRIAEHLHVRYRFAEQTTNQEILDGVVKGTFDAGIAAITITAQRERAVDFTLPYYNRRPWRRGIDRRAALAGHLPYPLFSRLSAGGFDPPRPRNVRRISDLAAGTTQDRTIQRRRAGPGQWRLVVRDRDDAGRRGPTSAGDAAGPSRRNRLDDRFGDRRGSVHRRCDLGFDAA